MRKILLVMALACLGTTALASDTNSDKKKSPLASDDSKARRTAPAKIGGLLNTDVTPEQARRVTEETNRQILRREKSKTPR